MKPSEQAIAALVVTWLEDAGHDVYQEVEYRGAIIDIVVLVGPGKEVWVVETKTRWSLELLTQCVERRAMAHRVFAGVPYSRVDHSQLFRQLGVGSLIVRPDAYDEKVRCTHFPSRTTSRTRDWPRELRARLGPGYKTHAKAGSPNGAGRWTPFRETCERLAYAAQAQPGITLKDAIAGMTHHYSSAAAARSSIRKWVELGKVPGVRLDRKEKLLRLFPS